MKKVVMAAIILGALFVSFAGVNTASQQASGKYEIAGMPRGA
ncbi:lysogeny pheromone AimP family peptide [Bacillus nakamurai]|nr:lysogeny pheromone AimP family peptide [Bacillus nakamurai]MED1228410.1 lysogeny pheromone AimP family peptide [Bacillus nakamurai]